MWVWVWVWVWVGVTWVIHAPTFDERHDLLDMAASYQESLREQPSTQYFRLSIDRETVCCLHR